MLARISSTARTNSINFVPLLLPLLSLPVDFLEYFILTHHIFHVGIQYLATSLHFINSVLP